MMVVVGVKEGSEDKGEQIRGGWDPKGWKWFGVVVVALRLVDDEEERK